MNYTKGQLKGSLEAVEADIKSLTWEGELVYPDYPNDYEKSFGNYNRFVITRPRQEVITPATFDEDGQEITAPVMGDYVVGFGLPLGYDTSNLNTLIQ